MTDGNLSHPCLFPFSEPSFASFDAIETHMRFLGPKQDRPWLCLSVLDQPRTASKTTTNSFTQDWTTATDPNDRARIQTFGACRDVQNRATHVFLDVSLWRSRCYMWIRQDTS